MNRVRFYGQFVACALIVVSAAGCGNTEPVEPSAYDRQIIESATKLSKLTNPDVPTGARQILKDRFIKFDSIQVARDRSRLLVDFQGPSDDPQKITTGIGLFDWKAEKRTDVIDWQVPTLLAFSPGGQRVAMINHNVEFEPLPDSGLEVLSFKQRMERDRQRKIASQTYDVRVRDLPSGAVLWSTGASEQPIYDVQYSDDGDTLLTVSGANGTLEFKHWDSDKGLVKHSAQVSGAYAKPNVRISNDASLVAVWMFGSSGPVKIYDSETGKELHSWADGLIFNVEFSPDGRLIATAGQSKMFIYDAKTGERLHAMQCFARELKFSPDGKLLWTTATLDREQDRRQSEATVKSMNRESPGLAVSTLEPLELPFEVSVWDCSTGKRIHLLKTGLFRDGAVAFLSNHELMTAGSPTAQPRYESPARIYVWDLNSDELEGISKP